MRRRFWGLLVAVIVVEPMAPARASVPVVVIEGQGFGHGVGMAQDGAFWMAKSGASTPQILGQFYPGTALGKVRGAAVRVAVFSGGTVTIAFPNGGRIDERTDRDGQGFPIRIDPGGKARLQFAGDRMVVDDLAATRSSSSPTTTTSSTTTTTAPAQSRPTSLLPSPSPTTTTTTRPHPTSPSPSPATTQSPSTTSSLVVTPFDGGTVTVVDRQRTYRGVVEAIPTGTGIRLVNQLDIEHYLRGMAEVRDPNWPAAALRTQAIAARTYALRAMAAAGEICDGQRCQVYLGQQAEYAAMDKAVAATAGEVLVYKQSLASAVYSANAGGFSASREEGFGTSGPGYEYLRPARYVTQNPMPWRLTVGLGDIAARFGHEAVTSVGVIAKGPSGRALTVAIDGPGGRRTLSGLSFAASLGLRSTLFSVRMAEADVPPPPPSASAILQTPPDELAAGISDTAHTPAALRVDLPDRPRTAPAAITRQHAAGSALVPLFALLVALAAVSAAGWRPGSRNE
jgi:stage II sporulation protein D